MKNPASQNDFSCAAKIFYFMKQSGYEFMSAHGRYKSNSHFFSPSCNFLSKKRAEFNKLIYFIYQHIDTSQGKNSIYCI